MINALIDSDSRYPQWLDWHKPDPNDPLETVSPKWSPSPGGSDTNKDRLKCRHTVTTLQDQHKGTCYNISPPHPHTATPALLSTSKCF